ncbi:E3 ubiquitin protein ligase RIN2 [Bienertia sinuspersici]
MGGRYLAISAVCTVVSMIGLQCWTEITLERFKADGLIGNNSFYAENASRIVELLLRSHATITLLAICVINAIVLFILSIKTIFFGVLYTSETQKLVERLVNYVIYKGTFLPLIIPPTIFQATLWFTWLTVLCFLKMFQALARDRLERLNASPSATPWTYFRAIVVHGFQLMDICLHHSSEEMSDCQRSKSFDTTAGSLWEWKSNVVRNLGFFLDMMTLLMALGHYVLIWWLHGMTFHLVDAILFLNIRALLSAVVKRIKGFIKLKIALGALHDALPDASSEEIKAYDDECAICWIKVLVELILALPVGNLFLAVSSDEQLARQLSSGVDRVNTGDGGVFPNQNQNSPDVNAWRGAGADTSWLQPWPSQGLDVAGPSTATRSAGLGRVQMMMRQIASVGETYAQNALEDTSWSLWPTNPSQATASTTALPPAAHRYPVAPVAAHRRTASHPVDDSFANLLAMAETVREVLPHIPNEMIFQDLRQTNSVAVTVNNLLQM